MDNNNRGGARKGAGRKNQDKVRVSASIDKQLAERLAKEQNKSAVIEIALKAYYASL